ncbi:hypothetical protein [uncultured Gimesia sp.]|uniref:DUF6946 family protein n=1 Tax=uncultured Gimesia sp. TaxID=1678688 RepID=UPI0026388E72|nr:hypothetical protein [uncultured Gimesia sp.]
MNLTGKTEDGPTINTVDDWFTYAPPARGSFHWKDYRSAKELAQAYCRYGEIRCPEELTAILSGRNETKGLIIDNAIAEMEIAFDEFGGGKRNADLALWGKTKRKKPVVITVEAKADETAGPSVKQKLAEGAKIARSNIPKRVSQLSNGIMGKEVDDSIKSLQYQFFPALAATAVLAKDKQAKLGVLIIHEFISLTVDFDEVVKNANALNAFIRMIPQWENESLKSGKLLPFIKLPGSKSVPSDIYVSIGKIRTLIPLGAGGRKHITRDNANQFILSEG